jgi:hypothetical protein
VADRIVGCFTETIWLWQKLGQIVASSAVFAYGRGAMIVGTDADLQGAPANILEFRSRTDEE